MYDFVRTFSYLFFLQTWSFSRMGFQEFSRATFDEKTNTQQMFTTEEDA